MTSRRGERRFGPQADIGILKENNGLSKKLIPLAPAALALLGSTNNTENRKLNTTRLSCLLQHLNTVQRRGSCISHGRDPASAGSGRDQDFLRLAVQLGREQADPSYVAAAPLRRFSPGLARGRATPPRRRG